MHGRLQPLSATGMLDAAVQLWRDRLGLYARCLLPFDGLAVAAFCALCWAEVRTDLFPHTVRMALPWVVAVLLCVRTLAAAAYVRCLVRSIEGAPAEVREAWGHVLGRPLAVLLPGLIGLFGLLFFGLLYVLVGGRCALAAGVAAVEGGNPFTVFSRAGGGIRDQPQRLGLGTMLFVLGGLVLGLALYHAGAQLIDLAHSLLDVDLADLRRQMVVDNPYYIKVLAAMVLLAGAGPRAAHVAVAYLDARVRADGFDLRMRLAEARQLRQARQQAAAQRAARLRDTVAPASAPHALRRAVGSAPAEESPS